MKVIVGCLAAIVILFGSQVWADCKADCEEDYRAEVESCKTLHDDPNDPDDAGELEVCLRSADKEYESCISECKD
jgi:hypothetical protein